jgi:hypothetical protein
MSYQNNFELREDGIYIRRGSFRGKPWWDLYFKAEPALMNLVNNCLETAYNMGEHDGRKYVRNAIKQALDIES